MKHSFIFPIVFVACFAMIENVTGQQKAKNIKFSSINSVGLLTGGTGQSFGLATINGVKFQNNFIGVGSGIDYYGLRSIPLFIDYRRSLHNKKNTPFAYVEGGYSFSWATKNQEMSKGYMPVSAKGMMAEGGVGIELKMKNSSSLVLSAGYSLKTQTEQAEMFWGMPFSNPEQDLETYKYTFRRIAIRAGIRF